MADSGSSTMRVTYQFETKADQNDWQVRGVTIREALSDLYTATVDLACIYDLNDPGPAPDPSVLVGNDCTLVLDRSGHSQKLHGIVTSATHGGHNNNCILANVTIEPALSALAQRINSRIFPSGLTAVDIIERILAEGLKTDYKREFTKKLTAKYAEREFTVQYRESDLDFISRLMQYEGINYFFDHTGDSTEKLVLVDSNDQFSKTKTLDGEPVAFGKTRIELTENESVGTFSTVSRTGSTDVAVRGYDWTQPTGVESVIEEPDPQNRKREVYNPGHLNIGIHEIESGYAKNKIDHENQSKLLKQRLDARKKVFTGIGYVTAFRPGEVFELSNHPLDGFDGKYLLTEVQHIRPTKDVNEAEKLGVAGLPESKSGSSPLETYENRFKCILLDAKIPFRPARSVSWPTISGPQTAIVVGPDGKNEPAGDIYTDKYGRIKVRFHWDRRPNTKTKEDKEQSSSWMRVAQSWAGPGYGVSFIPRIGMEVVVTFLEGNPDKPLVTGCVYNGANMLTGKEDLDLDKTSNSSRSAIRTATTPGGKGYNELRFEDKKGSEEIFVHAQKDYHEVVENNHDLKVHKDQSYAVNGTQTITVDGKHTGTYHGGREVTVEQFDNTTVKEANKNTTVEGQYNIEADEHYKVKQNTTEFYLKDAVELKSTGDITIKTGAALISLSPAGMITIQSGASKIEINALGVQVTGPTIKLN